MKCKYFTIRSEHYSKYTYCRKDKAKIDFNTCYKCESKEYKEQKELKKKTSKLQNLENNRFSILTNDMEHCFICKRKYHCDKHEIFSGSNRHKSMQWGLVVPLCRACHDKMDYDQELICWLQTLGEDKFIELYDLDKFIKEFGMDYKIRHENII